MRTFSARETKWLQELDGIELAAFWPRAFAFTIDWTFIVVVLSVVATVGTAGYIGVQRLRGKSVPDFHEFAIVQQHPELLTEKKLADGINVKVEKAEKSEANEVWHVVNEVVVPVLYFGILLWKGQGRTPGKRLMKIRVVSIVHPHITFWHSVERALGYGAAALELGFGFVQFFIHPYRRCAQDRLAETIVVTERGYKSMEHKFKHAVLPE